MAVVNNDKKWRKFEKSLQSNLELVREAGAGVGGTGGLPDVSDIFGVQDPQFANIMKSIGALETDIERAKARVGSPRSKEGKKATGSGSKSTKGKRQSYQSATAAM